MINLRTEQYWFKKKKKQQTSKNNQKLLFGIQNWKSTAVRYICTFPLHEKAKARELFLEKLCLFFYMCKLSTSKVIKGLYNNF